MELIRELKSKLDLAVVVGSCFELARCGRKLQSREHDSLYVDPERQLWSWFSQPAGPGQKVLGGDVIDWLAYRQFGRCKVEGDEFKAVLRSACDLAGLDYESQFAQNEKGVRRAAGRRKREECLAAYLDLAERSWTPEARYRLRRIKPYLTDEIMSEWNLGYSPTLAQLTGSGIDQDMLRSLGLIRFGERGEFAHFRDCVIFPYFDGGRVVYLWSRRLREVDKDGAPLPKSKPKAMGMLAPAKVNGKWVGMPRPAGFNLAALNDPRTREVGVLLVEGCADAIRCSNLGHPAIALNTVTVQDDLARRLRSRPDLKVYLALDGDVDLGGRCRSGASVGPECLVCCLPAGTDPDELASGVELVALKSESRPVLDEFLTWIYSLGQDQSGRSRALGELGYWLGVWRVGRPELAGFLRQAVCEAIGFSQAEYDAWLTKSWSGAAVRSAVGRPDDVAGNGVERAKLPPPLGLAPEGDGRKVVMNHRWVTRWVPDKRLKIDLSNPEVEADLRELRKLSKDGIDLKVLDCWLLEEPWVPTKEQILAARLRDLAEKYGAKETQVPIAEPLPVIVRRIQEVLGGWPHRIYSYGALRPKIFLDTGEEKASFVVDAADFRALIQQYATQKFLPGLDEDRSNYVSTETAYKAFGRDPSVPEYLAVEELPHEPPYPNHYYLHSGRSAPDGYVPTGEKLAQLIGFFDQVKEPWSKALLAAAVVTPFWGGPYGKKPVIVFEADQKGSGKTTIANVIGSLAGGALAITLDKRGEERVVERLLSPEGRAKRTAILDNLKGALDNALLEQLVTAPTISGKELAVGEGSRPNTINYLVTANNVQLSEDMVSRSFYVCLSPLEDKGCSVREGWESLVCEFIEQYRRHLIADCLFVLRSDTPACTWGDHAGERFPQWISAVLSRVLACEPVKAVIGDISVLDCLRRNRCQRDASNEDLDEAQVFVDGMLERVVLWKGFRCDGVAFVVPEEDIFIRTEAAPSGGDEGVFGSDHRFSMVGMWRDIFTRKEISAKWMVKRLSDHVDSGRIRGLKYVRKRTVRGWILDKDVVVQYLKQASQASQASLGCDG